MFSGFFSKLFPKLAAKPIVIEPTQQRTTSNTHGLPPKICLMDGQPQRQLLPIIVRDPPREHLAGSADNDEQLSSLARAVAKSLLAHDTDFCYIPTTNSPPTATPPRFLLAAIYHHCQDQKQQIIHPAPTDNAINTGRSTADEQHTSSHRMVKKSSSLQAILVPPFLQGGALSPTSPPPSPTALVARMRALSSAAISPSTSSFASVASTSAAGASMPAEASGATTTPGVGVAGAGRGSEEPERDTRKRSRTFSFFLPRSSPPPTFLIDEDPFANLTSAPSESLQRPFFPSNSSTAASSSSTAKDASNTHPVPPLPLPLPRSPLYDTPPPISPRNSQSKIAKPSHSSSSPSSPVPRVISTRAAPAHQRPAFKSRPSLPSLDTLARMNVVITKKPRRGKVGAGLPFEPWDDLPSDEDSTPSSSIPPTRRGSPLMSRVPSPISAPTRSTATVPDIDPLSFSSSTSSASTSAAPSSTSSASTSVASSSAVKPPSRPSSPYSHPHPIMDPQPLLPSQIFALGSVAADVEMVIPLSNITNSTERHVVRGASPASQYQQQPVIQAQISPPVPSVAHQKQGSQTQISEKQLQQLSEMVVGGYPLPGSSSSTTRSPARALPLSLPSLRPLIDFEAVDAQLQLGAATVAVSTADAAFEAGNDMAISPIEEMEFASAEALDAEDMDMDMGGSSYGGYMDVLESYHYSSRAGSEEGHGPMEEAITDEECRKEEKEEVVEGKRAGDGEREETISFSDYTRPEESRTSFGADDEYEGEGEPELEEMSFAANLSLEEHGNLASSSRLPLDSCTDGGVEPKEPYNHNTFNHSSATSSDSYEQQPSFMHSDSMLFSSPPSSSSLSRSMSFHSRSSRASSESAGVAEHAIEERLGELDAEVDEDPFRAFGSMHGYRRIGEPNPSLSSLDLDLGKADVGGGGMEQGCSTRSSSSHPSLSRTRSSEDDTDSDVLRSPCKQFEEYSYYSYFSTRGTEAFYHQLRQDQEQYQQQLQTQRNQMLSPQIEHAPLGSLQLAASSLIAAGEAEGEGFGFGFDKLTLAANVGDDTEDEEDIARSMNRFMNTTAIRDGIIGTDGNPVAGTNTVMGLGPSTAAITATTNIGFATSTASSSTPSSSVVSAQLSPNPPCTPDYLQTEFSHAPVVMVSTITRMTMGSSTRTSEDGRSLEPQESSGMTSSRSGSRSQGAYMSSVPSYPAGSSTTAYCTAYSSTSARTHRDRGQGNSDDEDEDEERRRWRLENGHQGDVGVVAAPVASEEEAEMDGYESLARSETSRSPSGSRAASVAASAAASPSTSPMARRRPSQPATRFPSSSAWSGQDVPADEDADEEEQEEDSGSDDDVPLAQRIPGALTAQKTIRRQFREEREQRKREKALRIETGADRRTRHVTLRPVGAGTGPDNGGLRGSHDATLVASAASASNWTPPPQARQRTLTLPGTNPGSPSPMFSPHDLARKLQNFQMADIESRTAYHQYLPQQQQSSQMSSPHSRSKSISRPSADHQRPVETSYPSPISATSPAVRSRSIKEHHQSPPFSPSGTASYSPPVPSLRPMRSFHRPSTADRMPAAKDESYLLRTPTETEHRVARGNTRGSNHEAPAQRSLATYRRSGERSDRPMVPSEPVPPLPASMRTSVDDQKKPLKSYSTSESRGSARTSQEAEHPAALSTHQPRHRATKSSGVAQQRVFVGNLQQFHMVEIGPTTSAGDIVAIMESEGALNGWAGTGGWMIFEAAQDFGMERPIRSFELLADVQASWLKDKTANYFILKLTPLSTPLAPNAIPSCSPTHSSYVDWEAKRGKWSKRWLQLREHSLWLSKRDNGKDEVLICSLSNFDTYQVTRSNRAPKQFSFAVKSTDNLSFFESTADYLHTFSCSEKDGRLWMEKILVARSYVLHQERHVLFNSKTTGSPAASATVSRSGTRKNSSTAQRPLQPLIELLPPFKAAQSTHNDIFEPGSLLSKQP